jgi:general secretion pathway protein M
MNKINYQRWLALGLLLLVLSGVVLGIFYPLLSNGLALYDEKNALLFRLERQQKILARRDVVKQNLESVKKQFKERGYFSSRDTESLATADLQNVAKTAITDAGGQLTSTQAMPGKIENGFNRITVRVRMTGTIESLRSILHTVATSVPIMIVDQLDISPVRAVKTRTNNKADSSSQLNVSFQLVSFMRMAK